MSHFDQIPEIRDLVAKFVSRELMPLESEYLRRLALGTDPALSEEREAQLREKSKELGLWGLDAPESMGGMDFPPAVMAVVAEEMARTAVPFQLPPDSPNLRMLDAVGTPEQKERYLGPYVRGEITSAIAISEPEAGGDPAAMRTRAREVEGGYVINGRKIWISNMEKAAFAIVMARVGDGRGREGITAFIVERDAPGFILEREIPMLGGARTFEIVFEDCFVPAGAVLGEVGSGYAPMQLRLRSRRLEMGSTAIGITRRALEMLIEHANQRATFGVKLADRQAIQWWIADLTMRAHAARLMVQDAALRLAEGEDVATEISMIKVTATELAYEATDRAMQTLGALGMTQETALYPMWQRARLMRIYEGPTEVHMQTIARRAISGRI